MADTVMQPSNIIQFPGDTSRVVAAWPKGALSRQEAARYLGIGTTKLWLLTASGKVKRTSYGTYPVTELDRHLAEELEANNG